MPRCKVHQRNRVAPHKPAPRRSTLRARSFISTAPPLRSRQMAPWVRTGLNTASGGGNRGDDVHGTFFNVLPSNLFYYGMANQLAFQNLVNWFAHLRVHPAPALGVRVYVHRFWPAHETDGRYVGPGAYSRQGLGSGASPSNGSREVGTEVDLVMPYRIDGHWSPFLGYAYLDGGGVFGGKDTHRACAQVALKYGAQEKRRRPLALSRKRIPRLARSPHCQTRQNLSGLNFGLGYNGGNTGPEKPVANLGRDSQAWTIG